MLTGAVDVDGSALAGAVVSSTGRVLTAGRSTKTTVASGICITSCVIEFGATSARDVVTRESSSVDHCPALNGPICCMGSHVVAGAVAEHRNAASTARLIRVTSQPPKQSLVGASRPWLGKTLGSVRTA
jgi:hypothetical protein